MPWDKLVLAWDAVFPFFKESMVSTIWDSVGPKWDTAWGFIKGVVTGAWDGIKLAWDTVEGTLKRAVKWVWAGVEAVWDTAWGLHQGCGDGSLGRPRAGMGCGGQVRSRGRLNGYGQGSRPCGLLRGVSSRAWRRERGTGSNWHGIRWKVRSRGRLNGYGQGSRPCGTTAWGFIKGVATGAWDGIKLAWDTISGPLKTGIKTIWDGIKAVWDTAWGGMKETVKGALNVIIGWINVLISAWNNIKFRIPTIKLPSVTLGGGSFLGVEIPSKTIGGGTLGGQTFSTPNIGRIPRLAAGGIVTGPTLAQDRRRGARGGGAP